MTLARCPWAGNEALYQRYHDTEWGVPSYDAAHLFEMLCLEGAQAGLNWWMILKKREHYRQVYDAFNSEKIATYDDAKMAALMADPGIIRNRLKVHAFVKNARAWLALAEQENPSEWLWSFVGGAPQINHWQRLEEVPAQTETSIRLSKALKKRGFTFVGPTIMYAFMQAVGMVNDHLITCPNHLENQT